MRNKIIPLFFSIVCLSLLSNAQELKPTQEEIQKLAKLKTKILLSRSELDGLNAKVYALNRDIIIKQQDINKSITDLNLAVNDIKEGHKKDWGSTDEVDYQPAINENDTNPDHEGGIFTKIVKSKKEEPKKEELKNGSENEIKKGKEKEGEKILEKKPKK